MKTLIFILTLFPLYSSAGVYGTLEFGDSRATVTKKLQKSKLVKQGIDSTFLARTGLNGVFECKSKLAGLKYKLFFDWTDSDGLKEITLRSGDLAGKEYSASLRKSWQEANKLFTSVYGAPVQDAPFPNKIDFKANSMLMTHVWHRGPNQSILIGPGMKNGKCFLSIRFVNKRIEPVATP